MKSGYVRRVVVFEDHFKEFKKTLDRETLKKSYQVFTLVMTVEVVPKKFLKSIVGVRGLYEIRIECEGNNYRVFCCFDEGNVVLFNGFQKKTKKTPPDQIEKAEMIMHKYFEVKTKQYEQ